MTFLTTVCLIILIVSFWTSMVSITWTLIQQIPISAAGTYLRCDVAACACSMTIWALGDVINEVRVCAFRTDIGTAAIGFVQVAYITAQARNSRIHNLTSSARVRTLLTHLGIWIRIQSVIWTVSITSTTLQKIPSHTTQTLTFRRTRQTRTNTILTGIGSPHRIRIRWALQYTFSIIQIKPCITWTYTFN